MTPILNAPADALSRARREAVLGQLAAGMSEDSIYRFNVDAAIRAARLVGGDEGDVEVAAELEREAVGQALAEIRGGRRANRGRGHY